MSGRRPPAPTAEERALFHATLKDARPLRGRTGRVAPAAAPAPDGGGNAQAGRSGASGRLVRAAAENPNPGLDRRTDERLRKGEIPIERRIDLHGLTQDDAHAALDRFVRTAWGDGVRMLLVITGKGRAGVGGVLRSQVPRWLSAGEHAARVLRIAPAQPRHGGGGAYYVLLRRRREPS